MCYDLRLGKLFEHCQPAGMVGMVVRENDGGDARGGKTKLLNPLQYCPSLAAETGIHERKAFSLNNQIYIRTEIGLVPPATQFVDVLDYLMHFFIILPRFQTGTKYVIVN